MAHRIGIFIAFDKNGAMFDTSSKDAGGLTAKTDIEHTGRDVVAVAVAESELTVGSIASIHTAIGAKVAIRRILGIEHQGMKTHMDIV